MEVKYIQINPFGTKLYFKDAAMTILHREDGPAAEAINGIKEWWLDGKNLTREEFDKKTAKEFVITIDDIAKIVGVDASKIRIVN